MKGRRITFSSVLVMIIVVLYQVFFAGEGGSSSSSNDSVVIETPADSSTDEQSSSDSTSTDASIDGGNPTAVPASNSADGVLADSGFDISRDAFSFENYGNSSGVVNLRADTMRRLFGDEVCSRISNEKCVLTPPARAWMKEINAAMDGGHCEGMAVLSLHMYHQLEKPTKYGGNDTYSLGFEQNSALQEEIAYWWATQTTSPTNENVIRGKPSDIVALLQASLSQGASADVFYTIGIYKSDGTGGHAITPVSITQEGKNKVAINIYDNNYPNELRAIHVNLKNETWTYEGSPNPDIESDLYEGDESTETLEITPSKPRLETQACDFCSGKNTKNTKGYHTYILDANALTNETVPVANQTGQTLFVTADGKRIGYVDGKLINEIEGATISVFKSAPSVWDNRGMPVIRIPDTVSVTLQLQNDDKYTYDVAAFGQDNVVKVEGLQISQTKPTKIQFGSGISNLKLKAAVKTSPNIYFGEVGATDNRDTATQFTGVDISDDGEIDFAFDDTDEEFVLDGDIEGDYNLDVLISDDSGDVEYSYDDLSLTGDDRLSFDISQIVKEGDDLTFQIDTNGDGEFDDTYTKEDNDLQIDSSDFGAEDLEYFYEEDDLDI